MYAGYTDGTLLFSVGMAGREISAGTLHRAVGEIDSADFVLPPSNAMRDVPIKRASVISIQKDGVEIFRGSVADTSTDLRGSRTYSVDGAMLWLDDICKAPFTLSPSTVEYYVTALLTQYNAACAPARKILLGTVDSALPKLSVQHTEYVSTLSLLQEAMTAVGGTMRLRYAGGNVYLDVHKSYRHMCTQQVDIRKNLLNLTDKIDGANLLTRVYPVGKDGLTIDSVNGGVSYLINADAEALYGRIDGTVQVDTDDPAVLKSTAASYLAKNCGLSRGIEVSAADLSGADTELEPFDVGDSVRVVSPPHGIDTVMTVSKMDTSLVGDKDSLTLGWGSKTLTGAVASGGGSSGGAVAASGGGIDVDSALSDTSTNPVQNRAIKAALDTKADKTALDDKLDKSGGTLTGNLTGKYITGTWLQTTEATDLGRVPGKIAVLDESGWVYYRTPAELLADIGAMSGGDYYTKAETDAAIAVRASLSHYGTTMLSTRIDSISKVLAATPYAVKTALDAAKAYADSVVTGADHVAEQGSNDFWTWRKWSSGIAELWAVSGVDQIAITTAWGSMYYGTWMDLPINVTARLYPFAFIATPSVSASYSGGDKDAWLISTFGASDDLLTRAPAYALARPTTATILTPRISYYVVGRYK